MKDNLRILTVCRQSLKNVQAAVRAYNMYKNLEKLGCKITYLDDWKPSFAINMQNIKNWSKIFLFKRFNKDYSRLFVENVQSYIMIKVLKKFNLPIVLDVRDDLNLHAESMGIKMSRKGYLARELAQIENFEIAQKILVTSQSYTEYYSEKYDKEFDNKFAVIMNASDPQRFRNAPLPQEPKIGILGGAAVGSGFDLLLDAARIVRKQIPNLSVHIGYKYLPQTKSYVDFLRENYKENWIHFYENIGYTSNARDFYSSLYLCVISTRKTKKNELSTPSKLFDCMASARPLVVTNCKEQAKIVKEENCGLVCSFTPEDMAKKIIKLLKNKELAQELGQNGRKAIEGRHNWHLRAKNIVEEIFLNQG